MKIVKMRLPDSRIGHRFTAPEWCCDNYDPATAWKVLDARPTADCGRSIYLETEKGERIEIRNDNGKFSIFSNYAYAHQIYTQFIMDVKGGEKK